MPPEHDLEAWCRGIIAKRPLDVIRVVADILDAGLRKGEATANDVLPRTYQEPNVVGATFKLMRRMGFVCDRTRSVPSTASQKHGRWVPTWILAERWKAERAALVFSTHLNQTVNRNDGQRLLAI